MRLWDPGSGQLERTLNGHTGAVNGVCAVQVADRQLLASAGEDSTVLLWNPNKVLPSDLAGRQPAHMPWPLTLLSI